MKLKKIINLSVCILSLFMINFLSAKDKEQSKAENTRLMKVTLYNNTTEELELWGVKTLHGKFSWYPPSTIKPGETAEFGMRSSGFMTGIEGYVHFKTKSKGEYISFYLDNPYIGSNKFDIDTGNTGIKSSHTSISGDHSYIEATLSDGKIRDYNILVMSDPQPWRLDKSNNDPNSDFREWESYNTKVVTGINSYVNDNPTSFGIINGDMTEFGRDETRRSFHDVYDNLNFSFYYGLGNHDYQNNVGDCYVGFASNGCARSSVFAMYKEIKEKYEKKLESFDYDAWNGGYNGSFSYSWDMGQIHYVQLQNYPTYSVNLDINVGTDVKITKSLDWLEEDLKKSKARGRVSIINLHDGMYNGNFDKDSSSEEKIRFKNLLKDYDVIAAFVGHSHNAGTANNSTLFGSIPVFNSGALFKGDFLSVEVKNKKINIKQYSAEAGSYKLIKDLGSVGK